ncbi:hypothetical protein [Enterococcus sp. HY326]|uniref:hypothetical protein n=1 Tax=Enterococcus sp. HY326 TaxID=2971265 RepID=UPI002240C443|nr:hypothetical protein [Enterococcus sp. HY326]
MELLVFDIGGTFIKYGIYDCLTNTLGTIARLPTPQTNQQELITLILNIKNKFSAVRGCAISIAWNN